MDTFAISCTTCRAKLKVRNLAAVGQILACPKCGSMVQVVPPPDWPPTAPALVLSAKTPLSVASVAVGAAEGPAPSRPAETQPAELATVGDPGPVAVGEPANALAADDVLSPPATLYSRVSGSPVLLASIGSAVGLLLAIGVWLVVRSGRSTDEIAATVASPADGATDPADAPSAAQSNSTSRNAKSTPGGTSNNGGAATTPTPPAQHAQPVKPGPTEKGPSPNDRPQDKAETKTSGSRADVERPETKANASAAPSDDVPPTDDATSEAASKTGSPAHDIPADEESPNDRVAPNDDMAPGNDAAPDAEPRTDGHRLDDRGLPTTVLTDEQLERRLAGKLARLKFAGKLSSLASLLADFCAAPFEIDAAALANAGLAADPEVSIDARDATARKILEEAAGQAGLAVQIDAGRVVVTAPIANEPAPPVQE